ncbi:MAG: hypothetical protein WC516_05550 [Patescibacteria group bacterium]|jgi:hypothetical protein
MSNSLIRLLKTAKAISDSGDIEAFNSFCVQFDAFVIKNKINKVAYMEPKNDGTTPNPWRKNMDYSSWENSPYYGSVSEFMEKFPGGIRDWIEWRNNIKKERFQLWDTEKTKERIAKLESLMKQAEQEDFFNESIWELEKEAYFEPVGPDNTKDFPKEPHLYSGDENVESFESVKKYIEEKRKATGQSADDATMTAAKDFVNYYKLLLKEKNRREKD